MKDQMQGTFLIHNQVLKVKDIIPMFSYLDLSDNEIAEYLGMRPESPYAEKYIANDDQELNHLQVYAVRCLDQLISLGISILSREPFLEWIHTAHVSLENKTPRQLLIDVMKHPLLMEALNEYEKFYRVGQLSSAQPEKTQYKSTKFAKARHPEPYRFEVNLSAESGKMQSKIGVVSVNIPGFSPVKLYCDEQPPVGEDTAPPPLAYFSAGIGFCLMTHLTDILTARKIQVDSLKLEQRIVFRTNLGHMREHGYMTNGGCDIVETHVIIESPEPEENIKDLLNEAENGCMAHYALRNPIPWTTRLVYNGKEAINRSSENVS